MKKRNLFHLTKALFILCVFAFPLHLRSQQNIQVGNGTTTNWDNPVTPFSTNFSGGKHQYLIPAANLINNNAQAGDIIGLGFEIAAIPANPGISGMKIKISTTSSTTVPSQFVTNAQGATIVYNNTGATTIYPTLGWNYFTFSSPFAWNGTDNLIVQVCYSNSVSAGGNYGVKTSWAGGKVKGSWSNTTAGCSLTGYGTTGWARPNMRFQFPQPPAADAGVTALISPSFPVCNMDSLVKVEIKNEGTDTLTSATLNWSVNGTVMTAATYADSLPQFGLDTVTLGTVSGGLHDGDSILVWSSMPNNAVDSNTTNDTLLSVVYNSMNGNYTIDTSGVGDFTSFNEAIAALEANGVCGPVTFTAMDSVYWEQFTVSNFAGLSDSNRVTFRSASGVAKSVRIQHNGMGLADNYVVQLHNTKHIYFEDLMLRNNGGTYSRVISTESDVDNSHHIGFDNCFFRGRWTSSTSTSRSTVYLRGNNMHHITLSNSVIKDGSHGLYMYGGSSSRNHHISIDNNEFQNQKYIGIYVYYTDDVNINSNYIWSDAIGSGTYGVRVYYSNNGEIANNHVKGNLNWPKYGMYLYNVTGGLGDPYQIYNNRIHVISSAGVNGFYNSNNLFLDYQFNSVFMGANSARCIYFTGGGYNTVYNNNFQNNGNGFAAYIVGSSVHDMDYNNLSSPNGKIGNFGGNKNTLSAWQNATGFDANSISIDSVYSDTADLRACTDSLYGKGISTNILTDYQGEPRPSVPTIGADEYMPIGQFGIGTLPRLCLGDSVLLEQYYFDTVIWNNTYYGNVINISTPGPQTVSVSGVCGSATSTFNVVLQDFVGINDTNICENESFSMTTNISNASFAWSNGSIDSTIQIDSAQQLMVTVTDAWGCTSIDSATITQSVALDLIDYAKFCETEFVNLTPTGTGLFTWNDGTNSAVKSITVPGIYSVTLTDLNCVSEDSVLVEEILKPIAAFTDSSSVFTVAFTNQSLNATSYHWDFGDGDSSNVENPTHLYPYTAAEDTIATVVLTATNECGDHTFTNTTVTYGRLVNVGEVEFLESVSVFPNPSNGQFSLKIETNTPEVLELNILSLDGSMIYQESLGYVQHSLTKEIQLPQVSSGIYLVRLTSENQSSIYRLVIK